MDQVTEGMVLGCFKHITFIVYFISVIIMSAPPQIIRYYILEVGDPCCKGSLDGEIGEKAMGYTRGIS